MAPNSRPPLTSRIRASFEGKRAKSDASPTHNGGFMNSNGFMAQDPDTLRTVIEEAINSKTFQDAIAASLANLIKPSITSALDTIQPVVEAVYSHEMLLRKTNRSVENILERMDTNAEAGRPLSTFVELDPLGSNPYTIVEVPEPAEGEDKPEEKAAGEKTEEDKVPTEDGAETPAPAAPEAPAPPAPAPVTRTIRVASSTSSADLAQLKQALVENAASTTAMKGQLDQLKTDLGVVMESLGSDIGKHVQEISEKVGAQDTSVLATHTEKLDAVSADLGALRVAVEAGNTSNGEGFTNVLAGLEGHAGTLAELKDAPPHPDILAALQQSNDAHATHTATLAEINAKSLASPEGAAATEGGSVDYTPALDEIKSALQQSNDSHAAHSTILAEIKDKPRGSSEPAAGGVDHTATLEEIKAELASIKENIEAGLATNNENVTAVGTKVDTVLTTIEGHKASDPSAEILAGVQQANESHAAHTAALEELKTANAAHTTALEGHGAALEGTKSPDAAPTADSGILEPQLASIVETLGAHSAVLDEMKASHSSHASALDEIKASTATHASTLDEIKTSSVAHTAVLDELKAGQGAHSATLDEIKATPGTSVVPAEGSDSSLNNVIETLEEHTKLLNEIKEDVSAEILTALHDLGQTQSQNSDILTEIREADLSDEILTLLHSSSDSHTSHTKALGNIHTAVLASNEAHAGHASALEELKSRSVEQAPAGTVMEGGNLEGLESKIGSIVSTLEEHNSTLASIKEVTQSSHDISITHAASLDEIKSRSNEPSSAPAADGPNLGGLEEKLGGITSKLEEHDTALASIKDIAQSSHELHTSHTASLDELKSRKVDTSSNVDVKGLEEKIVGIASSLLDHNASLATIKEATATHAAALDELKSRSVEYSGTTDVGGLEEKIAGISTTLEGHGAHLEAIKDAAAASAAHATILREIKDHSSNPEVLTAVKESHELIASNTSILNAIKDAATYQEILEKIAALKSIVEESKSDINELHTSTTETHSNLTTSIAALAVGGMAGAGAGALITKDGDHEGSSAEVLEEVKALKAIVDETKGTVQSMSSQLEINHTTITTSLSTLNEELKAEIDATGTQISDTIITLNTDLKSLDFSPVVTSVEQCSTEIKAVSTHLETLDSSIQQHGQKVTELQDGVHLNDRGISQLREHVVTTAPMTEGSWLRSSRPVSRRLSAEPIYAGEPTPEPVSKEISSTSAVESISEADASPEPSPSTQDATPDSPSEPKSLLSPIQENSPEASEPQSPIAQTLHDRELKSEPDPADDQETLPSSQSTLLNPPSTIATFDSETLHESSPPDSIHESEAASGAEPETIPEEESPESTTVQDPTDDSHALTTDIIQPPQTDDVIPSEDNLSSELDHPADPSEILTTKTPDSINHGEIPIMIHEDSHVEAEGASNIFDDNKNGNISDQDQDPHSSSQIELQPEVKHDSENDVNSVSEVVEHEQLATEPENQEAEEERGEGELEGGESLNVALEESVPVIDEDKELGSEEVIQAEAEPESKEDESPQAEVPVLDEVEESNVPEAEAEEVLVEDHESQTIPEDPLILEDNAATEPIPFVESENSHTEEPILEEPESIHEEEAAHPDLEDTTSHLDTTDSPAISPVLGRDTTEEGATTDEPASLHQVLDLEPNDHDQPEHQPQLEEQEEDLPDPEGILTPTISHAHPYLQPPSEPEHDTETVFTGALTHLTAPPSTVEDWQSTTEGYTGYPPSEFPPPSTAGYLDQEDYEQYRARFQPSDLPAQERNWEQEDHAIPESAPTAGYDGDGHLLSDGTVGPADYDDATAISGVGTRDVADGEGEREHMSDEERKEREQEVLERYEREVEPGVSPSGSGEFEFGDGKGEGEEAATEVSSPFVEEPDSPFVRASGEGVGHREVVTPTREDRGGEEEEATPESVVHYEIPDSPVSVLESEEASPTAPTHPEPEVEELSNIEERAPSPAPEHEEQPTTPEPTEEAHPGPPSPLASPSSLHEHELEPTREHEHAHSETELTTPPPPTSHHPSEPIPASHPSPINPTPFTHPTSTLNQELAADHSTPISPMPSDSDGLASPSPTTEEKGKGKGPSLDTYPFPEPGSVSHEHDGEPGSQEHEGEEPMSPMSPTSPGFDDESASASTSAVASPMSASFAEGEGGGREGGKKKKGKKGKGKGKK